MVMKFFNRYTFLAAAVLVATLATAWMISAQGRDPNRRGPPGPPPDEQGGPGGQGRQPQGCQQQGQARP